MENKTESWEGSSWTSGFRLPNSFEDKVNRFVRDMTKIMPRPKSEVRRRLDKIIEETEARVRREVIEIIKVPEDKVVNVMELAIRNEILEQLFNNLKGIK